jgi:hemerythrin superfamily protein
MPGTKRNNGQDAIALLKQDHKKVQGMLNKLQTAKNGDGRRNLFEQIEHDLKVHTQLEEEIFYPAFKSASRTKEQQKLYFEANAEHHVVDVVLPEMETSSLGAEEFSAKAKVLKDLVDHHIEEEEEQMFPKAKKILGAERLRDLGMQMKRRKDELTAGMFDRALGVLNPFARSKPKRRAA